MKMTVSDQFVCQLRDLGLIYLKKDATACRVGFWGLCHK